MSACRFLLTSPLLAIGLAVAWNAPAATTDIANAPLVTSTSSSVQPNLMFVLDDSGSMSFDYLPDHVNDNYCRTTGAGSSPYSGKFLQSCCRDAKGNSSSSNACWVGSAPFGTFRGAPPFLSSDFNGVAYNPAVRYRAPLGADGSAMPDMTAANTSNWTSVKNDAYGVQNGGTINLLTQYPDVEWCTSNSYTECLRNDNNVLPGRVGGKDYIYFHATTASGTGTVATGAPDSATKAARTFGPHYYTIQPGEYCTDSTLRDCQTTQSVSYPVPAPVRWCNSDANARAATPAVGACQALKNGTYSVVRYPTIFHTSSPYVFKGSFKRVDITPGNTYPKSSGRDDCTGSTCTYEQEMLNFANWWTYYHTRMQTMKSAAGTAFAAVSDRFRLSYISINNNTGVDFLNFNTFSGTYKSDWFGKLKKAVPSNSTPLRVSLAKVGRLYAGKYDSKTLNGSTVTDPMQYSCQKNYTLLSTDGFWNETSTPTQVDGSTAIGDQDSSLERPMLDGTSTGNALADVAAYYYNTDLRDKKEFNNCAGAGGADVCDNKTGPQNMTTFTLGLGVSGYMQFTDDYASASKGDFWAVKSGAAANPGAGICSWQTSGLCNWPKPVADTLTAVDDLWHAAVNGHGTYFSAKDPASLYAGLSTALSQIDRLPGAAAAATTSNPNVHAGDNFVFMSEYTSGAWKGELHGQTIDLTSGEVQAGGWTAQEQLDKNASRKIYTFSAGSIREFTWDKLTATEKAYFNLPYISSLSQFCNIALPSCLSPDAQSAAQGQPLVNFIRGDRSNEGSALETAKYFRKREALLGDIVDSEAVYVKRPMFHYGDGGYSEFKAANNERDAMVYVGANDGMLHAFNATTGAEVWAYVPGLVMPTLYKLADKDYASRHVFYVDGTPAQADVYFGGAWHTVLVGGLGAGGRGYYALDVTNPASPKSLWEFNDSNMGYSFGRPEIAKLADGTWVAMMTSGYNNTGGDGHGRLYIVNIGTGALIRTIDTGVGSAATPAGLSGIRAWVESADIDNTAVRVYGGDNLGNVWRFDVNNNVGAGGYDAQLLVTVRDGSGTPQPITSRPELGSVPDPSGDIPMVYVGTGRYLGLSDVTDKSIQTMYGIKDRLNASTYSNPRSGGSGFVEQKLTDSACTKEQAETGICSSGQAVRTGSNNTVDLTTASGWYADLPVAGERANTDPQLVLGTLIFTTNVPEPTACTPDGRSFINFLDYRSGAPVSSSLGVVSIPLGSGIATRPAVGNVGGKIVSWTRRAPNNTDIHHPPVDPDSDKTRRVLWRDLTN